MLLLHFSLVVRARAEAPIEVADATLLGDMECFKIQTPFEGIRQQVENSPSK